jgi:hypothetical protein
MLERCEPVDLFRPGDVSQFVEQGVFVGFEQSDLRVIQMFGHPTGFNQIFWMCIGISHLISPELFSFLL